MKRIRIFILVLSGLLLAAVAGPAAADGSDSPSLMTKLMVLFSYRVPVTTPPESVVARDKDWQIVKDAAAQKAARDARKKDLQEAVKDVAEREREVELARHAFRQETRRVAQGSRAAAKEDPLEAAARRLSQSEQAAYKAKLEYAQFARAVREERRSEAYAGL